MTEHRTPDLDRRAFLRLGVAGGAASLVAACGWDGGNAVRPRLLDISRLNDSAGEKILFSPTRLARTYTPAQPTATLPGHFISNSVPTRENPRAQRPPAARPVPQ